MIIKIFILKSFVSDGEVIGHIEENNGNKYIIFDSVDKNSIKKKYTELWNGIKNKVQTIKSGECK